jgi:hypothetical protein
MGKARQNPKSAFRQGLTKTKKKGDIELSEEELQKASGGSFSFGAMNAVNEKIGLDH